MYSCTPTTEHTSVFAPRTMRFDENLRSERVSGGWERHSQRVTKRDGMLPCNTHTELFLLIEDTGTYLKFNDVLAEAKFLSM